MLVLATTISAGVWSNRADLPGNPRLAELDRSLSETRFKGRNRAEVAALLGGAGRQILVPTFDGGWIEWDAGAPERSQTWVYSLRRQEVRKSGRREIRRENRRLVLNFDEGGKVSSLAWSCDTTRWRSTDAAGE